MTELLLPAGTRLIHIGPPKTGSTAIQNALFSHRELLLEHGVYNACGPGPRAREAGWAILGGKAPVGRSAPRMSAWDELVREVREAGGLRVVHSNEDYGRADSEQIKRIVGDLGGDKPHVVAVVRRLDRFLPSAWQERVKAREVRSYDDWLSVVLQESSDDWQWRNIWRPQRVSGLVERWSAEVGKENMTLVVADEDRRTMLPEAFESMLGLPAGSLVLEQGKSNRSLSYNETEVLRHINRSFAANGWSGRDYRRFIQSGVVTRALNPRRRPDGHLTSPPTPEWAVQRIMQLAHEQSEAVAGSGVRVLGDASHLAKVEPTPGDPTVGIDVETAAVIAAAMVETSIRVREKALRRTRKASQEVGGESPGSGVTHSARGAGLKRMLGAAVARVRGEGRS